MPAGMIDTPGFTKKSGIIPDLSFYLPVCQRKAEQTLLTIPAARDYQEETSSHS